MHKQQFRAGQLIKHMATVGDAFGLVISVWETEHLEHHEYHSEWVTKMQMVILWPSGVAELNASPKFFQITFPIVLQPE